MFLALVLDAIAIAGQVLVGRLLGAGDADGALAAARRMIELVARRRAASSALALLALPSVLPARVHRRPGVLERARALWPLFALMQPAGAARVRARRHPHRRRRHALPRAGMARRALAVFVAVALLRSRLDWGVAGVWAALNALMLARLVDVRRALRRPALGAWSGATAAAAGRLEAALLAAALDLGDHGLHHLDARVPLGVARDRRCHGASGCRCAASMSSTRLLVVRAASRGCASPRR